MTTTEVRDATPADLAAIAEVAIAAGQDEEWAGSDPRYIRHLLAHGRVMVAERDGEVLGFGASQQIGVGSAAITMLCDLFIHPGERGSGCGRAMLSQLWAAPSPRMTFSSLHAHALPLYTSFGLDAWWPLLYLSGQPDALTTPSGWDSRPATAAEVSALELDWTGVDRAADHRAWAGRPGGMPVLARRDGQVRAAGTVAGDGAEYGLVHLVLDPAADDEAARDAVLAVLAGLAGVAGPRAADGTARACLPGPHPAVRPLLREGWRVGDFDLFMATDPALVNPRRVVLSPPQA
jgi:GNAT superfamily N-acetyltransferase